MSSIAFESKLIPPAELRHFLKDSGLKYTEEQVTEPHRGAAESILHFLTENKEAIQFFVGLFGAFNYWMEYQKLQIEKRKEDREAEKHEVEMEMKRLEILEKRTVLHVTQKNGDVLILTNGTEAAIARQLEQDAPGLQPSQIERVELK